MQLNLNSISFAYPGAASSVVQNVSVTFPEGWTGLIGPNGCGKTTLASLAAGLLLPDAGSVSPKLFSSYCSQDASVSPPDLEGFALDWSQDAVRLRAVLSIEDEWLWNYDALSGGQRKRIQIACALWRQPDVLVMDEPTNDVDAATRGRIREALAAFKGNGILISHDRELLDALVGQCLMFEAGCVVMRPGGYGKASAQAEQERAAAAHAHETARREAARLRSEAQRRSQEAARSKARLSARNVSRGDSDARERLGRAKVSSKDGVAGRASAALEKRVQRAQQEAASSVVTKRYDPTFGHYGEPVRARQVLHASGGTVHAGGLALRVPELWVGPTDHVGLSGENGAGKSTLLRHLLVQVPATVKVASLLQEVDEVRRSRALETLRAMDAAQRGRALALVARLDSDPDRILEGDDVSPGEMRKLLLADQLLQEPNLLVLDEPTNHLDIGSIEALQSLLAAFSGALLLVTHDQPLLEAACSLRWEVMRNGNEARVVAS